jgi:excisionase family DNA binding protein
VLSIKQVAESLGVSIKTVRRLVKKKRLATVRYNERGKILIEPQEVERFKNVSTTPSKEAKVTTRPKKLVRDVVPREEWGNR